MQIIVLHELVGVIALRGFDDLLLVLLELVDRDCLLNRGGQEAYANKTHHGESNGHKEQVHEQRQCKEQRRLLH